MRDLRYALRGLRRAPLFTAAALLSLTLGIATATTVFSLVNAAILRQPPFQEADRVMLLNTTQLTPGEPLFRTRWSWPRFQLLQKQATSFEAIASSSNNVLTLTGQGDPEPITIELVSWRYHALLGAPIILGNGFTSESDQQPTPVILLGHEFWQRRFAGKPDGETAVFTTIAAIALLLAITGVYAVTASFVASRTRDFGVRMALGAPRSRIVSASLSHTVRLGVVGVLAGLAGAVATSRLLRAALYDTSPLAGGVYLATAGVLLLALVAASYLPVRKALGVSPADVLRSE